MAVSQKSLYNVEMFLGETFAFIFYIVFYYYMKNFKKLFSIIAIVAMAATSVPTATLGAASYSDELQGAYDYAYGIGITTQSSIDTANMYGSLIRSHMAKMMVNYATEVLGLTPDTSMACEFTDIANESAELQGYITEACQLGLMGVGITAFNPNGVVTRAQFGTVLSRALYGDTYNDGDPYYANHLAALQDAGIMNNISNPNAPEVRGYVMLMMQRAAEGTTTPEICDTPENVLSCSLGLDTCPTECEVAPEEKSGTLTVSLDDALANGTQVPKAGIIKFASVDFKANSDDVSLRTVSIKKLGLASIPSATRVWFEKNGVRVSGKAAFTSDGIAIISFAPIYEVKVNGTETLDLYVELAASSAIAAGTDFQFKSEDFGTTAENVNGWFTTPTLRTADYTVASLTIAAASGTGTANVTTNGMELGAFSVANTNYTGSEIRDVNFKSITLRQSGNASLSNLSDIVLERNSVVVASNPTINWRDITFTVGDEVKNGTTATYYIKAIVNDVETSNDTYQFDLRLTSDVNAVEKLTDFRCPISGTPSLYTNTIQGSDITFARDTNVPLSMNYAAGSDVVLMKWTITTKSAITLEDPTLRVSSSSTQTTGLDAMFSTIYLQVGNSIFSYSPAATDTGAAFLGSATVNGTATVKMYGKLKDTSPARTIKYQDLQLSSFRIKEYVSNGYTVATSIGSIVWVSVAAQTATLNVTRTDALGDTTVAAWSNGLTVYGLRLSSTQWNGVTVSNMVLSLTGNTLATGYLNNAYLTLYINGDAIQSKNVTSATSITFDWFNKKITSSSPLDIVVKANFVEAFSAGTFKATLSSLNAYDTLTSTTITSYAKPAGATFTIGTAAGALSTSNDNPLSTLLLSPSLAQKVAAFKLSASNDGIRLYDVTLTGSNLDSLSNFKLTAANGDVLATATTTTSTGVVFEAISNAPVLAKDTSATYYVVADVNSSTNTSAIYLAVTAANIKGSNGTTIAATGGPVISRTHATAENVVTLAMAANPSKSLTTSALRFTATAAGKTSVTLTGLTFNNVFAGYTGTQTLIVYKDSIATANIAGTGAAAGGVIALSANNVIDAGSTANYLVVVDGALVDSTAYTTDWSVSLTNVYFGGLLGATYNNVGALPFTSTK